MRVRLASCALHILAVLSISLMHLGAMPLAAQAQDTVDAGANPLSQPSLGPLTGVASVVAGHLHTCALMQDGRVMCWGRNNLGQVGDGSGANRQQPVYVPNLTGVAALAAGGNHTCALTQQGGVKCWGNNDSGQIGYGGWFVGDKRLLPVDVSGLTSGVVAISAGATHTCAALSNGQARCWGSRADFKVGDLRNDDIQTTPVLVAGTYTANNIVAGASHSCLRLANTGRVRCWGRNTDGQGGVGSTVPATIIGPGNEVSFLTDPVVLFDAGSSHTCVTAPAGTIRCWGENGRGQIGVGNQTDQVVATSIGGLTTNVTSIGTGFQHTCAVQAGAAKCWGDNEEGQLGNGGSSGLKLTPQNVSGLASGVTSVAAGGYHSCARMADSTVKCWGNNQYGQVGNNTLNTPLPMPTTVLVSIVCYSLTRAVTGSGLNPALTPDRSAGCPQYYFTAGASATVNAIPNTHNRVMSWSGPVAGNTGVNMAALTMPAADTTLTVNYEPCRQVLFSHTGNGGDPTPTPDRSMGCSLYRFAAGDNITANAAPPSFHRVKSWSGPAPSPAAGATSYAFVMPDVTANVSVLYEPCFPLTATATGQGSVPTFQPPGSAGCADGGFAEGESVTLTAAPAPGWRVKGWQGTKDDLANGPVNSVTMLASGRNVTVIYEEAPGGSFRTFLPGAFK